MTVISRVECMKPRAIVAFIEQYEDTKREWECQYGHFGCSTSHRGPCSDEALAKLDRLRDTGEVSD